MWCCPSYLFQRQKLDLSNVATFNGDPISSLETLSRNKSGDSNYSEDDQSHILFSQVRTKVTEKYKKN